MGCLKQYSLVSSITTTPWVSEGASNRWVIAYKETSFNGVPVKGNLFPTPWTFEFRAS